MKQARHIQAWRGFCHKLFALIRPIVLLNQSSKNGHPKILFIEEIGFLNLQII